MLVTICILCHQRAGFDSICTICYEKLILCIDNQSENNCFYYCPPASTLIKLFKYEQNLLAAKILTNIASRKLSTILNSFQAIIPMPVNRTRLKERGLHAADYLIRLMIKKQNNNIDIVNSFGWRIKLAKPQKSFKKNARKSNIDSSHFKIPNLEYKEYLVFDDVITTGTTWEAFKQAGKNLDLQLITLAKKCYNINPLN